MSDTIKPYRAIHHFRLIDRQNEVSPRGGATVAIEETDEGVYTFAVSCCSPADSFVKKVGRLKATKRLLAQTAVRVKVSDEISKDQIYKTAHELAVSKWATVIRRFAPRYNDLAKDASLVGRPSTLQRLVTK